MLTNSLLGLGVVSIVIGTYLLAGVGVALLVFGALCIVSSAAIGYATYRPEKPQHESRPSTD